MISFRNILINSVEIEKNQIHLKRLKNDFKDYFYRFQNIVNINNTKFTDILNFAYNIKVSELKYENDSTHFMRKNQVKSSEKLIEDTKQILVKLFKDFAKFINYHDNFKTDRKYKSLLPSKISCSGTNKLKKKCVGHIEKCSFPREKCKRNFIADTVSTVYCN